MTPQHNLPAAPTAFVGRGRELAEVARLAAGARLLTVTGAPGAGKSRFAVELARRLLPGHPDGAWWVDVAQLSGPAELAAAVAPRGRRTLLLLDGCEHVLAASAALARTLLDSEPDLRILATSRERLGIAGEVAWTLPPLGPDGPLLFVERLHASAPDLALDERAATAVVRICRRLDGLPLAIELAAARAGLLPLAEIEARLSDRFRLLTAGDRDAPPRHRTLRAAVDWSHDRLTEPERTLFARLSVFAGGFTLAGAEAVCADGRLPVEEILDALGRLVDRSLLAAGDRRPTGAPFRLLETLRAYAAERLAGLGEAEEMARRHAAYHAWLEPDERHEAMLARPAPGERENLRAALAWALEHEPELAARLALRLSAHWVAGRRLDEGRAWTARCLAANPSRSRARCWALGAGAWLAQFQDDQTAAAAAIEEGLAIARELDDPEETAWALIRAGDLAQRSGDFAAAEARLDEADRVASGPARLTLLFHRGHVRGHLGRLAGAREDLQRCRVLAAEAGLAGALPYCDARLGELMLVAGRPGDARPHLLDALRALRAGGQVWNAGHLLECLAWLAAQEGRPWRALRLSGGAAGLRDECGCAEPRALRERLLRGLLPAHRTLGRADATAALAEGRAAPRAHLVAYALEEARWEGRSPAPRPRPPAGLSRRELEIVTLLAEGLTNQRIADRLAISRRTAEGHVASIRGKLGFTTRAQVAAWAVAQGLAVAPERER